MSWPSTCFDHPNLATTIFWNPTKPTMPAAWLVKEEKPALYHWVPGNFSGPRSKQTDVVQRTDKTGRCKWSKSLNFECSPYALLRLFRCLTNLKTAHFWNSLISSNETYEKHAAYTFIQPSQSQKKRFDVSKSSSTPTWASINVKSKLLSA